MSVELIMTADTELFARLLLTLFSKEIMDRVDDKETPEPLRKDEVAVIVTESLLKVVKKITEDKDKVGLI